MWHRCDAVCAFGMTWEFQPGRLWRGHPPPFTPQITFKKKTVGFRCDQADSVWSVAFWFLINGLIVFGWKLFTHEGALWWLVMVTRKAVMEIWWKPLRQLKHKQRYQLIQYKPAICSCATVRVAVTQNESSKSRTRQDSLRDTTNKKKNTIKLARLHRMLCFCFEFLPRCHWFLYYILHK